MWEYEDIENLIENCTVRRKYKDGIHKQNELIAHKGYAMHLISDVGYTDAEEVYHEPRYSPFVIMGTNVNIYNYEAVLIQNKF